MRRYAACVRLRAVAIVSCVALSVGCGSSAPARAPLGLPTAGESIAHLLPPGADSCTISRTGAVPDLRRGLVRRVSHASPVAWTPGAPFEAYAEAAQRGAHGRAYRAVARVSDLALARRFLEEDAPVRVGFDEQSCPSGAHACWRARVVDERTIRLSMGAWDSEIQGAERRCASLARDHPRAIEVGVARHIEHFGHDLGEQLIELGYVPGFETEMVLEMSEHGLTRTETVDAPVDSEEEAIDLIESLQGGLDAWLAASHRHTRVGVDEILVELSFVWEDLQLAERDEQRIRHARALAAQDELPLAIHDVDVRNLPLVRMQLALHLERMADSVGAARRGHLQSAVMLLERALRVYPADEALSLQLARLYVEELHDGGAAAELATQVLARNPTDPETWRVLRRRALSSVGTDALRDALVEDGVVDRRTAADAAEALVGFAGSDYEIAEGAWAAVGRMSRMARRTQRVADVEIPIVSAVETLLNAVDEDGPSQHVFLALLVDDRLEQGGWGSDTGRVLTWPVGTRSVRFGASLTDAPFVLRDVANGLFHDLGEVDVELVIAAVPMGEDLGGTSTSSVRIRARVQDASLRVSAASMRVDWEALVRYVALPFAELEGRLFPPPDMSIDAESEQVAEAIVAASEVEPVLRCTRRGRVVDCATSPELDVTRRAWRRVVWPRVLGRAIPSP